MVVKAEAGRLGQRAGAERRSEVQRGWAVSGVPADKGEARAGGERAAPQSR